MRKYWKSSVIVIIIVFGIGTFYVNAALSATSYPKFVIQKKSGNKEIIENVGWTVFMKFSRKEELVAR